jgi:hypothetical protein
MKVLLFFLLLSLNIFSEPKVFKITQSACQFLEFEKIDFKYKTTQESDCEKINSASLQERKKNFQTIKIKSGEYKFSVLNKDIPYEVGFWIRGKGLSRFVLPSTSGGGLIQNTSKDYSISLKPGTYLVSCPLNPTPDYEIVVE